MQLSEAILLGDMILKRNSQTWLIPNECGCAIGRAYVAGGGSIELYNRIFSLAFLEMWPWLNSASMTEISLRFNDVCMGYTSMESLVDYVRSIEPKECAETCTALALVERAMASK